MKKRSTSKSKKNAKTTKKAKTHDYQSWLKGPEAVCLAESINLRAMLGQGEGFVCIKDFLPQHVAEGLLDRVTSLKVKLCCIFCASQFSYQSLPLLT